MSSLVFYYSLSNELFYSILWLRRLRSLFLVAPGFISISECDIV